MAHHLGLRKCLSPNSQRGDVWVVNNHFFLVLHSGSVPLLDQVLTEVPPTMRALARQNFGRADDLALTPMRLGRGFCLTGRGEERKGNGW